MEHQAPDSSPTGVSRTRAPRASGYALYVLVEAFALGVGAGIVVGRVGGVVSGLSISGPGWSLSGNGALSVIAVGLVAGLGGGWAAVAARVWWPRRVAVGLLAWLTSLVVAGAWVFSFLLPEPYASLGEETALPAVLAALVGLVLPRVAGSGEPVPRLAPVAVGLLLVAALASPGMIWAGFYWIVTPLLVTLPLLSRSGRQIGWGWLLAACLAVLGGLLIGGLGGI